MSKVTKKQLQRDINNLVTELTNLKIELLEKKVISDEPKPQLKQLDQSIFNGLDEKWRFAAVDSDTRVYIYEARQHIEDNRYWFGDFGLQKYIGEGYDASDWQNSLIERDIAKELLEVDLSSELTGSELCRAMLARGDKFILCGVSDVDDADAASNEYDDLVSDAVTDFNCKGGFFGTVSSMRWYHAVPINNQGEPLTASEVGL